MTTIKPFNTRSGPGFFLALFTLTALVTACGAVPVTAPDLANTPPAATATPDASSAITLADFDTSPVVAGLLTQTTEDTWLRWVRQLSGAEPVAIGGESVTLTTRFTIQMFAEPRQPNAVDFVRETIAGWYPEEQIEIQEFGIPIGRNGEALKAQNIILTLPGSQRPDEIVILSAHLDSVNLADPSKPSIAAPGAEDNASGSAALLEAARLFRDLRFERTLKIIWFTGEEQGLVGSKAYVAGLKDPDAIQGVINLDMFGYDSDNDRCFEIHMGTLPRSERVAGYVLRSIEAYALDLPRYDLLKERAISASDHGSFWDSGIGAVQIFENMIDHQQPGGCPNADHNPHYHSASDTVDKLNPASAIQIVRAALASAAEMSGVID